MTAEFNILLTSAGRRVSLLRSFREALAELGLPGRVIAADRGMTAPAVHAADAHELVPRVDAPEYVAALLDICQKRGVKLVIPLIDTELHLLAPHRSEFAREGVELLVSSVDVTQACLDKRRTHDVFVATGARTPRLLDLARTLEDPDARFPLFLKPASGSCSIGARRVANQEELAFFAARTSSPILQELVEGDEYTMDVLVDFSGRTRCIVPRLRMETRAGEISKGVTVKDPVLIESTQRVVDGLRTARGCITVQCFLTAERVPVFIEINPRFGGGFPLAAAAGAAFPKWLIEWVLGRDPHIVMDGWRDGVVMLRYDDAVFVQREAIT